MSHDEPPRVLFILGSGRNGSTIMANVLGSAAGAVNLGEMQWIWERGASQNRICGCGRTFDRCPFWVPVMEHLGGVDSGEATRRESLRLGFLDSFKPSAVLGRWWSRWATGGQTEYLAVTEGVYRSAAVEAGTEVIIDSSKRPVYGRMLNKALDVYVLHLVRDPRAVVFSWLRKKVNPDFGGMMPIHPSWKSAAGWMIWNITAEVMRMRRPERYLRVRYEDFISDPKTVTIAISAFVGADLTPPISEDGQVEVTTSHSVSGNPSRFDTGLVRLRADHEWRSEIRRLDRAVATLITWPLMLRYSYPLLVRGRGRG